MANKTDIELLKNFLYENKDLEQLEEISNEFSIFTALNIVNSEERHSDFLAWLMNPNESHGMGDYFLKKLILQCISNSDASVITPSIFDIDTWNLNDSEVLREWHSIDIFVKSDQNKFILVIENKIRSQEHSGQLKRYTDTILREFPSYNSMFVYLTIAGERPKNEESYIVLSYHDISRLIKELIENKKDKAGLDLITFIDHYQRMLGRYIVEDSEIQDICKRIYMNHKKALDLIFEYRPDKQLQIRDSLEELINNDMDLIFDSSTKTNIRFIPKNIDLTSCKGEGWVKSGRILLIEITNTSDRVDMYLIIGPGPQEIRSKIYDIAQNNPKLFKNRVSKLYPKFTSIYRTRLLSKKEIEERDIDDIGEILKTRLNELKNDDLLKIEAEIRKIELS